MEISARLDNRPGEHSAVVSTDQRNQTVAIAPRPDGYGSSLNGGELLCLALATCYCNDLYREARKREMKIARVQVEVRSRFEGEGTPAREIRYSAMVEADAPREAILELIAHTDTVAEIQNTLRSGMPVRLSACEARPL